LQSIWGGTEVTFAASSGNRAISMVTGDAVHTGAQDLKAGLLVV